MNGQETKSNDETLNTIVVPCDCATWGRDNVGAILHLEHHPNCERYRPEPEIRELLQRLIDGIELWAINDGGVHPDCLDAYAKACEVCGQWSWPKVSAYQQNSPGREGCADHANTPAIAAPVYEDRYCDV